MKKSKNKQLKQAVKSEVFSMNRQFVKNQQQPKPPTRSAYPIFRPRMPK